MREIGWYVKGYTEWTNDGMKPSMFPYTTIYVGEFPETLVPQEWQHIGYIFPNDPGGTIFPNKLTGGQNAVAAYVKRPAPPVVEPDPRDKRIAELERALASHQSDYLDRAAFAALTLIEPKQHVDDIAREAYQIAAAMLQARDAAPASDQ